MNASEISCVHMSQAWARLSVPALPLAAGVLQIVYIVPQNSIADLNDVELCSTRTCPCSCEKFCTDHASPLNMIQPSQQQANHSVSSVSHNIGFRRTRLAPVIGSRWCQGCSRVCPRSIPGAAAHLSQKLNTLIAATAACDSGLWNLEERLKFHAAKPDSCKLVECKGCKGFYPRFFELHVTLPLWGEKHCFKVFFISRRCFTQQRFRSMCLQEKTALTVMLPALNAICTLKFAVFSRKQGRKRTCTGPPIIVFSSQMFTLGTIPENWCHQTNILKHLILAMCWVHPVIKQDVSHCHHSTAQEQTLLLDAGMYTIDDKSSWGFRTMRHVN